ncbi:WD repeat-containing protein 93 [Pristis pectinata]|uniref:WD repeat-containing protein 93 n=1 Tax=Pristis pectinata TaxID=685728 RepID=UPI00223DC7C3|nr:WD repeat-containing protein 93 [Pristis pectinata]
MKHLVVPTPSEHNWNDNDENDYYLKDPEQLFDELPQPFRMIDKLIGRIIENACEIIEEREAQREAERLKKKIPLCESSEEIRVPGNVNCLASSVDGSYVFAGLSEGVAVLNMEDHTVKTVWKTEDVEIVAIQVKSVGSQLYVLAAVDDMGLAHLLFYYSDIFSLIKVFNASENISERNTCSKFELSDGGDYAGVTLEAKGESWLEVYRLMKDSWIQELDQFLKLVELSEQTEQMNPPNPQDIKLTPPVLVLKVRPKQITDCLWKNPFDAILKLDDGNIIGTGQNHVITTQQWNEEKKIFEEMYETYLSKDTTEESEEKQSQPTFHFLNLGRLLPVGLEQKTQAGLPNDLCVWWSGSHVLFHYILKVPGSKEKMELEPKANIVWPNASPITCSAGEICASLLVIGLTDGTVTVWDLYMGIPISVLPVSVDSAIRSLHILEPSYCVPSASLDGYSKSQILATCKSGAVYLISATAHSKDTITTLRERTEEPGNIISAVALVPQLSSQFLLILRNGTMALLDCIHGDTLCHYTVPFPHVVASPWKPIFAFDRDGNFLFIKGDKRISKETPDQEESSSSLFAFSLLSLFPLDKCTKKKELRQPPTRTTWEIRCEQFLQERLKSVKKRNEEMTKCWNQLQHHAMLIMNGEGFKKRQYVQ